MWNDGRRFQPGEGPSRGLLRDYENFAESSLRAPVSNQAAKTVAGSGQLSAEKP